LFSTKQRVVAILFKKVPHGQIHRELRYGLGQKALNLETGRPDGIAKFKSRVLADMGDFRGIAGAEAFIQVKNLRIVISVQHTGNACEARNIRGRY
jgi:hypothetical protein